MTSNDTAEKLLHKLNTEHSLSREEWTTLIQGRTPGLAEELFLLARRQRHHFYGHDVYIRGLIEFTNYCRTIVSTAVFAKATKMLTCTG